MSTSSSSSSESASGRVRFARRVLTHSVIAAARCTDPPRTESFRLYPFPHNIWVYEIECQWLEPLMQDPVQLQLFFQDWPTPHADLVEDTTMLLQFEGTLRSRTQLLHADFAVPRPWVRERLQVQLVQPERMREQFFLDKEEVVHAAMQHPLRELFSYEIIRPRCKLTLVLECR